MMTISPGRSDGARDEAPCPSPIVRPESARRGGRSGGRSDLGLGQVDLIRTAEKLDSDATHGMPPLFKADSATLSLLLALSSRELSSQEPYQRCRALCANYCSRYRHGSFRHRSRISDAEPCVPIP